MDDRVLIRFAFRAAKAAKILAPVFEANGWGWGIDGEVPDEDRLGEHFMDLFGKAKEDAYKSDETSGARASGRLRVAWYQVYDRGTLIATDFTLGLDLGTFEVAYD